MVRFASFRLMAVVFFGLLLFLVFAAPQCPPVCQTGDDCSATEYCAKLTGRCDGIGVCKTRPEACDDVYDPVCGCDLSTTQTAVMPPWSA